MEVHHPTIEKKNFKEYLLEFLIIFLVVTVYRKMIDNIFWLKPGSILFVPPAKLEAMQEEHKIDTGDNSDELMTDELYELPRASARG